MNVDTTVLSLPPVSTELHLYSNVSTIEVPTITSSGSRLFFLFRQPELTAHTVTGWPSNVTHLNNPTISDVPKSITLVTLQTSDFGVTWSASTQVLFAPAPSNFAFIYTPSIDGTQSAIVNSNLDDLSNLGSNSLTVQSTRFRDSEGNVIPAGESSISINAVAKGYQAISINNSVADSSNTIAINDSETGEYTTDAIAINGGRALGNRSLAIGGTAGGGNSIAIYGTTNHSDSIALVGGVADAAVSVALPYGKTRTIGAVSHSGAFLNSVGDRQQTFSLLLGQSRNNLPVRLTTNLLFANPTNMMVLNNVGDFATYSITVVGRNTIDYSVTSAKYHVAIVKQPSGFKLAFQQIGQLLEIPGNAAETATGSISVVPYSEGFVLECRSLSASSIDWIATVTAAEAITDLLVS